MKVLFWVGYSSPNWDKGDWIDNGMGGSEYCVIKLADHLDVKGHDVTITGDVKTGNWHGVQYIHHNDLLQHRGPRGIKKNDIEVYEHYDVVIAINYLNVFKHLEEALINYDRAFFWMHNEDFYIWHRGNKLHNWEQYITHPKLKKIVGVSQYHIDEHLKPRFKALGYTPSQLTTYIHSIDNAIDLNDYKNRSYQAKVKNRIIWSSTPDRGLKLLLDNWATWKQQIPDLSLEICCPPYGVNWMNMDVSKLEDVNWQGAKCPNDLKTEIAKAEYWIYASNYTETYCITALEMMMGKVKLIHNGTGNLGALIGNDRGTMIEGLDASKIIEAIKNDNDNPGNMTDKTAVASTFAMKQNWSTRVDEWIELIK